MKKSVTTIFLILLMGAPGLYAQNKEIDWMKMLTYDHHMVNSMRMQTFSDDEGNIISVVPFQWDIHVGMPPEKRKDPEPPTVSAGDQFGFFLVKNSSDGDITWTSVIKMGNRDQADTYSALWNVISDMAVVDGNIYLTGIFEEKVDFGNGISLRSEGRTDMFVAKFNRDGSAAWAIRAGGKGTDVKEIDGGGQSIAADKNGNVYAIGVLNAWPNGGGTIGNQPANLSKDGATMTLIKLSKTGEILWFKKAAPGTGGTNADMSLDAEGNLYISGSTQFLLDWDGNQIKANGLRDAMMMKLDGDGNYLWGKVWGWGDGAFDGTNFDNEGISKMSLSKDGTSTILLTLYDGANFEGLQIKKAKGALGPLVTIAANLDKDGNILKTYLFDGDPLSVPNPVFGTYSSPDGRLYFTLGKKAKINGEKQKETGLYYIDADGSSGFVYNLVFAHNAYGFAAGMTYSVSGGDIYVLTKLDKTSNIVGVVSPKAAGLIEKGYNGMSKKLDKMIGIYLMKYDL